MNLINTDVIVHKHANMMINEITTKIRRAHPEFGNKWGLTFLVSRPAAECIPIASIPITGTGGKCTVVTNVRISRYS